MTRRVLVAGSMTSRKIDHKQRSVSNSETRNGHPKIIPLTPRTYALVQWFGEGTAERETHTLPITGNAIRLAWNRTVQSTEIEDLRFHDLRQESINCLFEKGLSVTEVASLSGHVDRQE